MAEMQGTYANEQNHKKVKRSLKKSGIILLCVGVALVIISIILLIVAITSLGKTDSQNMFSKTTSSAALFVVSGILLLASIFLIAFGVYATFFAHAREIASYAATTVTPVVGDVVNYASDNIAPKVNNAIGGLAEKISGGIASGIAKGKQAKTKTTKCAKCETLNAASNTFCSNCGEKLNVEKFCENCGNKLNETSNFCPNCGNKA